MNFFISEKQFKKKKLVENASPIRLIKLEIAAGQASATPPLGPSLGMYGINISEFCKEFNEESEIFEDETIIPIFVYLGINKQHYFEFKLLSVAYLIRKYLESMELESGMISKVDFLKICYNIALFRALIYEKDSINVSESYLKNSIRCIIGTFRSFRYKVIFE